jgi:eukaryotic-like serine/threonine-protein kinase
VATHSAGTRLGPYEILSSLGAGGMGDVYKARDSRLDRIVALKISKEEFTPRFETEARATAALEHQHICRLYDVCHEAGASFLVMEYVEGTPLKGPLPLDQALTYARQIASALDEAHRKQIVHRDLKPSNILVNSKNGVKLLDFGLAKFSRGHESPLNDEALTRGLTAAGTILGTLHYMSPEQLQGASGDARSDVFAFGLVLYEMVAGKRAFDGASAASVIAAILERPAPSVAEVAPASLDRLIARCLAKDPEERWQSARDVKAGLDLITEPAVVVEPNSSDSRRRVSLLPWVSAVVLAMGLAALALLHFRETTSVPALVRFQVPSPDKTRIVSPALVSPDGRLVAFLGQGPDGVRRIWVRRLDALETRSLAGTEDATPELFWSADSRFIAFDADRKLKTIEVSGNGLRTLCNLGSNISGGAWNADGVLIFGEFTGGLFRISTTGGTPVQLLKPSAEEYAVLWPSFLPDGHRFVYVGLQRDRRTVAHVATLDGVEQTKFDIEPRTRPVYVLERAGATQLRLLFNRNDAVVARRVNATTLAPVGEAELVVDGVAETSFGQPGLFSASSAGVLVYIAGEGTLPTQLIWFDRSGKPLGSVGMEGEYNDLSLSPDETRVIVTRGEGNNGDLWLVDLARNVPTRFTFDGAQDWHPVWSPDGKRIAFSSTRRRGGTTNSVFWKDAGNIGNDELLFDTGANERLDDWSPDGKLLLINRTEGRDSLWIVPIEPDSPGGDRKAVRYLHEEAFAETRGQFLPLPPTNGRYWIVYTSNESGQYEIYVESYPRGAPKVRISTNGGMQPRWRRDGKELFYMSPDRELMAVNVAVGPELTFGTPQELFQTRLSVGGTVVYRMLRYDVTRDGKRFLINTEPDASHVPFNPVTVVLNWTTLLKQ